MITINNLSKSFGNKIIFKNFTVNITKNKVTVIKGESGSGKTTLARIIAGLDNDYTGEITKKSTKLSYVFQEPRLFDAITVKQNLEIVENNSLLSVNELLSIVELDNDINTYPRELSGGMKMRLSIARAIRYNGDVFIMDEPFSALDNDMKKRLIPKIMSLLKNKTVIVISHDISELNKYVDNVLEL